MTFPSPGTSVTSSIASSTTHNVTMPTCSAGDLLMVFGSIGSSGGPGAWGTTPTGWTKSIDRSDGTANRAGIFCKIADGSESGGTVNFPSTSAKIGTFVAMVIASGTWGGTIATDVVFSSVVTNTNPPNPPSLTSGFGSVDTLWIASGFGSSSNDSTISAPTNYSDLQSARNGGSVAPQTCTAYRQLNAASDDPGSFTGWANSTNQSWTVAIKGPDITNTTSTPDAVALTITTYAPATAQNNTRTIGKVSLLTTLNSITVQGPQLSTPGVKALTLTEFSVGPSTPVVTPIGRTDLDISFFLPRTYLNTVIITGSLALSSGGLAPTVRTPNLMTPGVKTLTTTGFAPLSQLGQTRTIGKLSLTMSLKSISALFGALSIPDTASLTTTKFAPSIHGGQKITIGKLSLTTTKFAPFLLGPKSVTIDPLTLSLNSLPAELHAGPNVSPDVAALVTTSYAPVLTFFVTPHPLTKALTITSFAPKALIPRTFTPATRVLVISGKTVLPHVGQSASIGVVNLVTATFAPTFSAGVPPDTLHLVLTELAPNARVGFRSVIGRLDLNLTRYSPGSDLSLVPGPAGLVIATFAPSLPRALRQLTGVTRVRALNDHAHDIHRGVFTHTLRRGKTQAGSFDKVSTPNVRHLATSRFAPTIIIGHIVTPDTYSAIVTSYSPATLSVVGPNAPGVAELVLTGITLGSFNFVITPGTKALNITTYVLS